MGGMIGGHLVKSPFCRKFARLFKAGFYCIFINPAYPAPNGNRA